MIRVAIIGTGNISPKHIHAWQLFPERCRIVALCDIYPEKAEEKARRFGIDCAIYEDYRVLLEKEHPDIVDVCTPPFVHAEISIAAMRAGSHVLCEKPMAASLEECDQVIACQRETGKLYSSIAQNRYRTPIRALKRLLDSGIAGPVKHVQVDSFWWRGHSYYDLWWRGTWEKEGGGCTLNHAVHHIDMLSWMMGQPETVSAVMRNLSHDNAEVEDLSIAICEYPAAIAQVTSSVVHHGEEQQVIFQCANARISAPFKVAASVSRPNGFPDKNPDLEKQITQLYESCPEVPYVAHDGQIDNVLTALETGQAPEETDADGRRTIELITAIYKAASTGEKVRLPLQKDDPFYTVSGIMAAVPHFYEKSASLENFTDETITVGSSYQS